jgi:hypothetical protein
MLHTGIDIDKVNYDNGQDGGNYEMQMVIKEYKYSLKKIIMRALMNKMMKIFMVMMR